MVNSRCIVATYKFSTTNNPHARNVPCSTSSLIVHRSTKKRIPSTLLAHISPSKMPPDALTTMEIRPHPTKGRALYSLKPFHAGQPIHAFSSPLILHPSLSHLATVCTHCLRPGSPRACSRCHAAYYCDAACQHAGWAAIHSMECKPLRQHRLGSRTGAELPTPVRALVQVLLKKEVEDGVKGLEGHVGRKRNSKGWRDLEMMALAACAFAGMGGGEGDVRKADELLCKVSWASFDVEFLGYPC